MTEVQKLARRLVTGAPPIGITTATIIKKTPLTARLAENIVAERPHLFYAAGLTFEVGDRVIICASEDNQRFYVLGKAVQA